MTRTKPAAERRADLLAAGQALFVAKGIAGTSLEDITTGAGVSKGLFYLYFRSKEDLVLALQQQFSDQLADQVQAAAAAQDDWAGKLDACVRVSFDYYRGLHDLHEILFHHPGHAGHAAGSSGPHPHGQPHRHEHIHDQGPDDPDGGGRPPLVGVLRDLLTAGVAAGAYHLEDPDTTAVIFYTIMHGFDHDIYSGGPAAGELVRAAQQLFRRAAGVAALPPATA